MEFFNISKYENYQTENNQGFRFFIKKNEATADFVKAANYIAEINSAKTIPYCTQEAEILYVKNATNESLIIKTISYSELFYDNIKGFQSNNTKNAERRIEYHIYDDAIAWNYSRHNGTGFPCSMKDFFYYQNKENIEYDIFKCLFNSWSKKYIIWKDLQKDFEQGTAYGSIPLEIINSCKCRRELIDKYYQSGQKRNNKENIGNGIFYSKLKSIVEPKEIQKLYGYNCPPCFIDRQKKSLSYPLSFILYNKYKETFLSMYCSINNQTFTLTRQFIQDSINMSIELRRKIPLTFNSVKSLKNWHDYLVILQKNKEYPIMNIPKNSIFKTLKLPSNCIRLTTRKQMVEEGLYQNNCVASYISSVNCDICSIWSMRNSDGSRNTIEICVRKSKNQPTGYFYINQMLGFNNTNVSKKDWDCVKQAIDKCKPNNFAAA